MLPLRSTLVLPLHSKEQTDRLAKLKDWADTTASGANAEHEVNYFIPHWLFRAIDDESYSRMEIKNGPWIVTPVKNEMQIQCLKFERRLRKHPWARYKTIERWMMLSQKNNHLKD